MADRTIFSNNYKLLNKGCHPTFSNLTAVPKQSTLAAMGSHSILTQHVQVVANWHQHEREFLQHLADHGQSPDALYIGCSDSRVVPELLTASSPGRLFVVRNIANLVPPIDHADASVGAALDYAVGHLHVPHLVVCGHDGCGGVQAAMNGGAEPQFESLNEWLLGIQPAVDRAGTTGSKIDQLRRTVEANVVVQLENLLTFPLIRQAVENETLQLHGWVFDIKALSLRVYDADYEEFVPSGDFLRDLDAEREQEL